MCLQRVLKACRRCTGGTRRHSTPSCDHGKTQTEPQWNVMVESRRASTEVLSAPPSAKPMGIHIKMRRRVKPSSILKEDEPDLHNCNVHDPMTPHDASCCLKGRSPRRLGALLDPAEATQSLAEAS